MKTFLIRTLEKGHIQEHHIDLNSDVEAFQWAATQGLHIVSVQEKKESRPAFHRKHFSLLIFCQECHALLEAGLTIPEVIDTLYKKEADHPEKRALLMGIQEKLREGKKLSDIFSTYPEYFPSLLITSIKASEQTGAIADALSQFIDYEKQTTALTTQIKSALIYPGVVLSIGSCVILFLLAYVLPKFATILNHSSNSLPYLSQKLLDLGSWIAAHKLSALTIFLMVIALLLTLFLHPKTRHYLRRLFMTRGPWRHSLQNYQKSRFFRALSMLLEAGIPLLRAIESTRALIDHSHKMEMDQVILRLQEGHTLSYALQEEHLSDPISHSLIGIGEKSGTLSTMLLRSALFHEEQFRRWIEQLTRIAEPLIMTILGLVVGGIVVLMYMPIFNLASSVL